MSYDSWIGAGPLYLYPPNNLNTNLSQDAWAAFEPQCYQDVQPYPYLLELPPRHPSDYSSEVLPCTDDATELTSKYMLNHGSNGLSDIIHLEQRHLSLDTSLSTDGSFYAAQPAQLVPLDSGLSTEKSPCPFYSFNHTPVGSSDGSPCSASSADTQHPPMSSKDNLLYRLDSQAALKSQQQQVFLPLAQQEQVFLTNRNSASFPQNNQEQELFLPISEEHQPILQSDREQQSLLQHAHEQRQLLPTMHEGQMRHHSIHEQEQLGQMSSHRQEQVLRPSYEEEQFPPNLEQNATVPPNHGSNNIISRSIATTAPSMATASIPVEIDVRNVRELLTEYQQRRQSNTSTGSSEKENLTPKQRRRKAQNRAAQQAFRTRKRERNNDFEAQMAEFEGSNNRLQVENDKLKALLDEAKRENERLKVQQLRLEEQQRSRPEQQEATEKQVQTKAQEGQRRQRGQPRPIARQQQQQQQQSRKRKR